MLSHFEHADEPEVCNPSEPVAHNGTFEPRVEPEARAPTSALCSHLVNESGVDLQVHAEGQELHIRRHDEQQGGDLRSCGCNRIVQSDPACFFL
jgi:hypothetical protein